jgi:UDP-glucuronate 4-epimerase
MPFFGAALASERVLVTGAAGFIGFHLCRRLLAQGVEVVGVDHLDDYYDRNLKLARLERLDGTSGFRFERLDIQDSSAMGQLVAHASPGVVVNLAAQAGVRYSVTHPYTYLDSNLSGFLSVLEACRGARVGHLVFASSSSVYGMQSAQPFSESLPTDRPISLYAATKKANEVMAHSYCHLYGFRCTGLRFFTVYGPWGRPDMALFKFTKAILAGEEIQVYGEGRQTRDFTYVDDVVEAVVRVMGLPPADPAQGADGAYRLYNVGCGHPVPLMDFIGAIEKSTGKKAALKMVPMQPGDVASTFADIKALKRDFDFEPVTAIGDGVANFVEWYRDFYKV